MDVLDQVIRPGQIDTARRLGACRNEAIAWLRASPRRWRELTRDYRQWVIDNACRRLPRRLCVAMMRDATSADRSKFVWTHHDWLGRAASIALVRECRDHDRAFVVRRAHRTLGRQGCVTLVRGYNGRERASVVRKAHATLGRAACLKLLEGCQSVDRE